MQKRIFVVDRDSLLKVSVKSASFYFFFCAAMYSSLKEQE